MNLLSGITGKSVIFVFWGVSDSRQLHKEFRVNEEGKNVHRSVNIRILSCYLKFNVEKYGETASHPLQYR